MNLAKYLYNKDQLGQIKDKQRQLCLQCLRPQKACFCSFIKPFPTQFRFVILMHPREARKERVGTGRLTHLTLTNSKIIVDKSFDENKQVQEILNDENNFCFLLYPGESALNLSREKVDTNVIRNKAPVIFILDGTWPCAKSMMRDSHSLHQLPRLSFEYEKPSRFVIKQQPISNCLSTIESVHRILEELKQQGLEPLREQHHNLLEILDEMVKFQITCANDPSMNNYQRTSKPYKLPNERKPAKKWTENTVCFK